MGQCCTSQSTVKLTTVTTGMSSILSDNDVKVDNTGIGDIIVSVDELNRLINQKAFNLRILDVTVGGAKAFTRAHIDKAVYFDIFHKVENTKLLVRNVPTPEVFQHYVRHLGISNDSDIIIYDQAETGAGYISSGRAWFLFKYFGHDAARILDGGLAKWQEAHMETRTTTIKPSQGSDFTVNVKSELLWSFGDMMENMETNAYQIFDTRPLISFSEGHIKGAKNVPYVGKLISMNTKCLHAIPELKAAFEETGIDLSKPMVATCTGGMTSTTALVALSVMGIKDVPLYLGSWIEWVQRAPEEEIDVWTEEST